MFENFSVVGFPCNQFHGMEPLGNEEIHKFIKDNYPFVTFPISEKIEVNGDNEHQVFTFVKGNTKRRHNDTMADMSHSAQMGQSLANETINRVPSNYEKFIIGKNGRTLMRFRFSSSPLADESETLDSHDTIKSSIKIALDIP
jgi:glutathione peroxidase